MAGSKIWLVHKDRYSASQTKGQSGAVFSSVVADKIWNKVLAFYDMRYQHTSHDLPDVGGRLMPIYHRRRNTELGFQLCRIYFTSSVGFQNGSVFEDADIIFEHVERLHGAGEDIEGLLLPVCHCGCVAVTVCLCCCDCDCVSVCGCQSLWLCCCDFVGVWLCCCVAVLL